MRTKDKLILHAKSYPEPVKIKLTALHCAVHKFNPFIDFQTQIQILIYFSFLVFFWGEGML